VPSSTSSSSERAPAGPWRLTWLAALLVAGAAFGGLEALWRSRGHRPSVVDDADLWACHRRRVYGRGHRIVALLGASRMQLGFDTRAFRERFPHYRLVQLAIGGDHPIAALQDLARDPAFNGVVICAMTAAGFRRRARDEQQDYVDHYHEHFNTNARFNRLIAALLQGHLVFIHPRFNTEKTLIRALRRQPMPRPTYLIIHMDRSGSADYTRLDIVAHRRERVERVRTGHAASPPPTPDEWLQEAAEIEPLVQDIHARGGRVVFLRFPSSGEHLELDERYYPRRQYWDRFAAITSAVTVHFQDVPGLAGFDCPDASHLDERDAPRFTLALADELVRLGVLLPAAGSTATTHSVVE